MNTFLKNQYIPILQATSSTSSDPPTKSSGMTITHVPILSFGKPRLPPACGKWDAPAKSHRRLPEEDQGAPYDDTASAYIVEFGKPQSKAYLVVEAPSSDHYKSLFKSLDPSDIRFTDLQMIFHFTSPERLRSKAYVKWMTSFPRLVFERFF